MAIETPAQFDDNDLEMLEEELKGKQAHMEALMQERNRRFPELAKGSEHEN
jgi:hypothetical protein